jgi:uncharacterized protein YecE (DUF72 family)
LKYYIGCSGWSYDSWKGPFYPDDLDNKYWLPYYSKIFKFVEVDSTFYRIPSRFMVQNWARRTQEDFRFAVKFPKVITHDKQLLLDNITENLERFFEVTKPLQKKIVAFLIQLPPWLQVMKGLNFLKNLESQLDKSYRYAIEVRHQSWFNDLAFNYFKQNDFCLVWSQMDRLVTPPVMTTDFVYLRLIGDRSIDEKDFGKIQKERMLEMQKWSKILKDVKDNEAILKTAVVSANNHYAGFGPMTARMFEEIIDPDIKKVSFPISDYKISGTNETEVDSYDNRYLEPDKEKLDKMRQSSISDFL